MVKVENVLEKKRSAKLISLKRIFRIMLNTVRPNTISYHKFEQEFKKLKKIV